MDARRSSKMTFGGLALAPAQLAVELPEIGTITADLRVFEAIEGFDAPGVPTPGTTVDDLRYVWRGQGQGYDVIVAEIRSYSGMASRREFSTTDSMRESPR